MESIPAAWRGPVSGLLQAGYPSGYLLASLLYLAHDTLHWRGMFMAGAVPALLVLYIRNNVPESPDWSAPCARPRDRAPPRRRPASCRPHPLRRPCSWHASTSSVTAPRTSTRATCSGNIISLVPTSPPSSSSTTWARWQAACCLAPCPSVSAVVGLSGLPHSCLCRCCRCGRSHRRRCGSR